jgi:glycosyltransferase involved in cell wall biosynthesis
MNEQILKITYPQINSVQKGIKRPIFSVMIPTCNRFEYLERTLQSVIDNDLGLDLMEIVVIDNSTINCGIEELVNKIGKGRIKYFKQCDHVGMSDNWTTCVRQSSGHWVHILHDDDLILSGFYEVYLQFIKNHPEVNLIFSRAIICDENESWRRILDPPRKLTEGVINDSVYDLLGYNFIAAAAAVISRSTFEKIGGFAKQLKYCSDWEMYMRIAASGKIGYIDQPHSLYRHHYNSETSKQYLTDNSYPEMIYTFNSALKKIPIEQHKTLRKLFFQNLSKSAISTSRDYFQMREYCIGLTFARWAIRCMIFRVNPF